MWRRYRDLERRNAVARTWLRLDLRLRGNRFLMHRIVYPTLDFVSALRHPPLFALHRRFRRHLEAQRAHWKNPYSDNYFYQGLETVGIRGSKPSLARMAKYGIRELLKGDMEVLDIGSNCGFWALSVAPWVRHVDGVEVNPHLNAIAEEARAFLGIRNAEFHSADFKEFVPGRRYDLVFSLSNHQTIDGNTTLSFQEYVARIWSAQKDGALLLFESHNVWGPGQGGVGDDGDLEAKFRIMSRYFTLLRYKMVECFYPADIDKLFAVLRRKPGVTESDLSFDLAAARQRYEFVDCVRDG